MFDPHTWTNHLTSEQIVRLAEALPSLMTAAAALSASITSLVVAIKARQAATEAQRTAEDATDQAREAAKEQIRFALKDVVRRSDYQDGVRRPETTSVEHPSLFTPDAVQGGRPS